MTPTQQKYANLAADGLTIGEIAEATGATYDGVRGALNHAGIRAVAERDKNGYREVIKDMRPQDAVEYLLEVIDALFPCLATTHHPVDDLGIKLRPKERTLLAHMWDRMGQIVTHDHAMSILYFDEPDDIPDRQVLGVYICHVRKGINGTGLTIKTHWGLGWSLHRRAG